MGKESYSKKILLIYITKVVGVMSGFLSMLMVVPRLTSNPEIYGIYTVCLSLNMFFTYADLGFISAGQKYAAEYFIKNDKKNEMQIIGFVCSLLAIFLSFGIAILIWISIHPSLLLRSATVGNIDVSSKLILILALFSPTIIIQRINSLIYSIRVEEYINQGIEIAFNLLKIVSIQLFITKNNYDIVGYFFLLQILSLVSASISLIIGFGKYDYSFLAFLKCFRLSKQMYALTKSLAFSSLLTTLAWILYFELDAVILSKFYGLKIVAIYAIGFTFLSFIRTMYSTLYGPFLSRFNHFVGKNDEKGLQDFFKKLITFTFPLCIIPPFILIIYMKDIIRVWVGHGYLSSVMISQLFVISSIFSAFSIPIGFLILAKSRNQFLRINALTLPPIFFLSLFIFDFFIGYNSLAVAKVVTIVISSLLTFYFLYKVVGSEILKIYFKALIRVIPSISIMCAFSYYLPVSDRAEPKSVHAYLNLAGHVIPCLLISLGVYYTLIKDLRTVALRRLYPQNTFML